MICYAASTIATQYNQSLRHPVNTSMAHYSPLRRDTIRLLNFLHLHTWRDACRIWVGNKQKPAMSDPVPFNGSFWRFAPEVRRANATTTEKRDVGGSKLTDTGRFICIYRTPTSAWCHTPQTKTETYH
eukprot:scaffold161839_cov19-Prasinocladus_malaysianus.AAC.1